MTKREKEVRSERRVAVAFGLSTLAGLGLAAQYVIGPQAQAEGVLLAISLGGLGYGLIEWAKGFTHEGPVVGDYPETAEPDSEQEAVEVAEKGWEESLGRRKLLIRMLGGAAAALGLALVFPIRSLGPSPGRSLQRTSWRKGVRLVREDGRLVRAGELDLEGIITVFPENHTDAADSQTVLIRVDPSLVNASSGREDWAPEGHIAYSKICTHAGCPVGLYRAATHDLFCPCHQSTFDVLDGAKPVSGPATRALPQLPLKVDDQGYLIAEDDFSEPVGPGFWNLP
ncbi:MAG: cytochrome bc1 complex Rieske iron-sulfur subunit [Actinomycetota bacterium]